MLRRSVEGSHPFSHTIAQQCNIFDLGGLLLDDKGNFTAAVEAFELEPCDDAERFSELLYQYNFTETIYMACVLAESIAVPFYVFTHKMQGGKKIHRYRLQTMLNTHEVECIEGRSLSEQEFIEWWQCHKKTKQVKTYREQLLQRAQHSYFDALLESHDLKWGGNIDGYIIASQTAREQISAVIENRFTNVTPLASYDPNSYFSEDYQTWRPLMILKERLNIPLFLMTYSNRKGEEETVGITRILSYNEKTLHYIKNAHGTPIRPCDNIFDKPTLVKNWIFTHLD